MTAVGRRLHERKRVATDLAHGHAVGKETRVAERHRPTGRQRLVHRVGVHRLDTEHANRRHQRLHVGRDAGEQPAAADGHEDGAEVAGPLPEDLVGDGRLPGNHPRIVVRMDEREPRSSARRRRASSSASA